MDGLAISRSVDNARGQSPTGQAIRSGKPQILAERELRGDFAARRERVRAYGNRAGRLADLCGAAFRVRRPKRISAPRSGARIWVRRARATRTRRVRSAQKRCGSKTNTKGARAATGALTATLN
jgi:hypothetical protein